MGTTHTAKIKRSFSISPQSEALLRREMKARHSRSASQTLDDLLAELERQRANAARDLAVAAYYDALEVPAEQEERSWGELGSRSLLQTAE